MKKYILLAGLFFLITFSILNSVIAIHYTDFSVGSVQQLTTNPYKGDFVQFKATVTADSGNWCYIVCQYSAGSNSGYVSDSGQYPSTQLNYGNSQAFPFSIRADGSGNVSQTLIVTCDKSSTYLCALGSQQSRSINVNFNFLYVGDGICTSSKEKCESYQSFIGTDDCKCSLGKECRPDGNRSVDERGCQTYCGNGIYEPSYEDCSCSQDFSCGLLKKCKPDDTRTRDSSGCASFCGNGICEGEYENCTSCPQDCKKCNLMPCQKTSECQGGYCVWNFCWNNIFRTNDGHCDSSLGENCANSPIDCSCDANQRCNSAGSCETYCGNEVCEANEAGWCKADCHWCGDGVCDANENCATCAYDCGPCRTNDSLINNLNINLNISTQNNSSNNVNENKSINWNENNNKETFNANTGNETETQNNQKTNESFDNIINQSIKYEINKSFLKENYKQIIFVIIGLIIMIILAFVIVKKSSHEDFSLSKSTEKQRF